MLSPDRPRWPKSGVGVSSINQRPNQRFPGIAFRHEQTPRKTDPPVPVEDLDQLPNPARYFQYRHVAFTRGCPGNCTFCGSPLFWGPRVRTHSPGYFVDQLELLTQKGINFFYFSDDTFILRLMTVLTLKAFLPMAKPSEMHFIKICLCLWKTYSL